MLKFKVAIIPLAAAFSLAATGVSAQDSDKNLERLGDCKEHFIESWESRGNKRFVRQVRQSEKRLRERGFTEEEAILGAYGCLKERDGRYRSMFAPR